VRIPAPEQRLNEYPHQLSGGMRQRVMIAMALINKPKLLIADEPTTALDVTVQAQILELIADLRKEMGMSVILITHDLGVIAEVCDEVAVMYGGRIVERAEVHQLFAHPRHAYTQGLLASIPKLESTPKSLLPAIPGNVPSIADFRSGCRFADRSGRLHTETQLQTRAPMVELNPGHWVEDCGACVGIESTAVSLTPSHPNDHENDIHRLTPAQSSWQAALAYLGRSPRPGGPPQGRPERREERQRQLGILAEWAKDCGKLVAVSSLGTLMDQASEHQVYYDPAEGKAVKVTIPGRCGNTFPGGGFDAALPSEYCNRWLAYNEFFGDQVMFEGVALSGGEASLVVSQRWIKGDRPSSDDIFRFMAGLGMTQAPNLRDYYSISAGIAVLDAHLDNFIIDSEGDVVPIDVHVVPLDTNIRRALGV
jgi:oligopeptide/dipeptide ABC transporter ATP-binding protein